MRQTVAKSFGPYEPPRALFPGDHNGEFKTSVVPRGKQYEKDVVRDCGIPLLAASEPDPFS